MPRLRLQGSPVQGTVVGRQGAAAVGLRQGGIGIILRDGPNHLYDVSVEVTVGRGVAPGRGSCTRKRPCWS